MLKMPLNKKRKFILIVEVLVLLLLVAGVTTAYFSFKKDNSAVLAADKWQQKDDNIISIIVQNENGEYEKSDKSSWPTEDEYTFNNELSKCENGSTLTWENNKVKVKAATSDKCYVYFDLKK